MTLFLNQWEVPENYQTKEVYGDLATPRKMEATIMGGNYSCPGEEMVCSIARGMRIERCG